MMEEKPETQPKEIVGEQPKASFLEKLKSHKFKILGGVLGVLILVGAVFGIYKYAQRQIPPEPIVGPTPTREVTLTTDKLEYKQGEPIKITVRNGLDVPILYYDGRQFWGIEYLEDGKWKNPAYERGGGFQLTEKNEGDTCYILLYERMPPYELRSDSTRSQEWNQRICPFGEEDPSKPTFVKYIGAGHYRLIFYYGFEISSEDPYKIKDEKTIYSNEFTIKEKLVLPSKNCNDYEMPMTDEETQECTCPEGYKKFNRLMGVYCATDSQKPCRAQTDCPKDEGCISHDGKNWFCTGAGAGCYHRSPENPEEQICVD